MMQIFLDIDGVMVPSNSWKPPQFLPDGFADFSPKAVTALKRILKDTNASLVLTSSHKSRHSVRDWKKIFDIRGVHAPKLSTLPDNATRISRKEELLNWLAVRSPDQNFVIIDDDKSLNDLPPHLKNRLVLTDGAIGLTDSHAEQAIAVLNEDRLTQ